MRLPNSAHTSQPWRIHELAADFQLEDVWALPDTVSRATSPRWCRALPRATPPKAPGLPRAVDDPLEARRATGLG